MIENSYLDDYETLLDKAIAIAPKKTKEGERFVMPNVSVMIEGSRTMITNFREVCDRLNRDPKHLLRFLAKELATAGVIINSKAMFQGKFGHATIKNLVDRYVKDFVICPVCTRPDTRIEKRKKFSFLTCDACGAVSSIKTI